MKTLIKSKALLFAIVSMLLVTACGKDNTTSNGNNTFGNTFGINGQGGIPTTFGGSTGNQTLDMIFQSSTCQSSLGPQAYTILGVSNQGGTTQPIQNFAGDIMNVYVGRNLFGDVVVLRSMGSYAEMIIKVCARSYAMQGQPMGLVGAGGFYVNASRHCTVNEITRGQVNVRIGNTDIPILPSALHLHQPLSPVCSGGF